jgi:nucleotide-binding universal stress UspA family protein
MSSPRKRVLVVSNEILAGPNEVPKAIRPLVEDAEEIYVIAPTLTSWLQWLATDVDGARVAADQRLHTVFDHMQANGLTAHGAIGEEDQVVAIADALAEFNADLIVLRLHAPDSEHESWHEHRIAERVRSHFDLPTMVFFFDDEGRVVARQEA